MDRRTALATTFTCVAVAAAAAWTALNDHARREFVQLMGFGNAQISTDDTEAGADIARESGGSASLLEVGVRPGVLAALPWTCRTCEVRLHVDPALPPDLARRCEARVDVEPFEEVTDIDRSAAGACRLSIALSEDGSAHLSAWAGDFGQNDEFDLALPARLVEGAPLELSGAYFSDISGVGDERPPYHSVTGTLTLGSALLVPGTDVPIRLELTAEWNQARTSTKQFRLSGLAHIFRAPEAAPHSK